MEVAVNSGAQGSGDAEHGKPAQLRLVSGNINSQHNLAVTRLSPSSPTSISAESFSDLARPLSDTIDSQLKALIDSAASCNQWGAAVFSYAQSEQTERLNTALGAARSRHSRFSELVDSFVQTLDNSDPIRASLTNLKAELGQVLNSDLKSSALANGASTNATNAVQTFNRITIDLYNTLKSLADRGIQSGDPSPSVTDIRDMTAAQLSRIELLSHQIQKLDTIPPLLQAFDELYSISNGADQAVVMRAIFSTLKKSEHRMRYLN